MTDPRLLFRLDDVPDALRELFDVEHAWQILERLDALARSFDDCREGRLHPSAIVEGPVHLAPGAEIGPHAFVQGPAWIGEGAQVGHGAYLRGGVVLMAGAKVGHASEVKRSVFLPGARAPHFNYVGDSVLGRDVNLGAGVKIANFKAFGDGIRVGEHQTGLRKLGAALGDGVSIGCNAVLAPGTVIGPHSVVYHGAMLRGLIPGNTVVKLRPELERAPLELPS